MARIADLPWKHRLFVKAYPFRVLAPVPWTPLRVPLSEARIGLVTTAAFYLPGQVPFDEKALGGDTSYRVLGIRKPIDDGSGPAPELRSLAIGHRSTAFDEAGIAADYNLALPVDRLLGLEEEGVIGWLYHEALSFMGSITAPGRLVKATAPEAAARFKNGGVDGVLLCPV